MMGTLAHPPVAALALALRQRFGLTHCIETGTFTGTSTAWAAAHFEAVTTIEIDFSRIRETAAALGASNVAYLNADSRDGLPIAIGPDPVPTLFWLDAHNADHLFGPGDDDCPLLEELSAIFERGFWDPCILIDDAQCFTAPRSAVWPSYDVIASIADDQGMLIVNAHDVIAIVPVTAQPDIEAFTAP
jgi:hypothetical protein